MNDLITEARELCERATPGPWVSENMKLSRSIIGGTLELLNWASNKPFYTKQDFSFIARSRTIIPDLCDALEKAEAEIERLKHICQPVCRSCGLSNARFFINNSCDRCGGDLRLPAPSEKEGA